MPDAQGNFKGIAVPSQAWLRIFGVKEPTPTKRGEILSPHSDGYVTERGTASAGTSSATPR